MLRDLHNIENNKLRENTFCIKCVIAVKLSLYRPLGLQEFEAPRIYRH